MFLETEHFHLEDMGSSGVYFFPVAMTTALIQKGSLQPQGIESVCMGYMQGDRTAASLVFLTGLQI